MKCIREDCDGRVEASVPLWLSLDDDGWHVYGIGDEAAKISCDAASHDCYTPDLGESLSAFIEATFPGTSWRQTDPRIS